MLAPGLLPLVPKNKKGLKVKISKDTSYNGGIDVNAPGLCLHSVYNSVYTKNLEISMVFYICKQCKRYFL